MKKSKGQTFVEFLLVFVVLLVATTGVFAMYKKVWKNRYINTSDVSAILIVGSAKGLAAKADAKASGYGGYVK
ncbi:MAG: hypothetical protein FWG57_06470 [Endomicrobia bacterium]|nr:hypothetical protein [Endomicrobiia bacterium]